MRLTELQATWYRKILAEELDFADGDLAVAQRAAYAYWNEYVRGNWKDWLYAQSHESEADRFIRLGMTGMVLLTMIRNAAGLESFINSLGSNAANILRLATGVEESV